MSSIENHNTAIYLEQRNKLRDHVITYWEGLESPAGKIPENWLRTAIAIVIEMNDYDKERKPTM